MSRSKRNGFLAHCLLSVFYAAYQVRAGGGGHKIIEEDWEKVRQLAKQAKAEGFSLFMGYEWQGAGLDGDHNICFLDKDQIHPFRYQELVKEFEGQEVIGIPHHLAYQPGSRGKTGIPTPLTFLPLPRSIPAMAAVRMTTAP